MDLDLNGRCRWLFPAPTRQSTYEFSCYTTIFTDMHVSQLLIPYWESIPHPSQVSTK